MVDAAEISERMNQVRQRGVANAQELSHEVERLSDWREHVRAHPLPLAFAAISLGYFIVPQRRRAAPSRVVQGAASAQSAVTRSDPRGEAKTATTRGVSSAALVFVGSLISNAIRSYVSEQVHSLINPRANDAAPRKW